jgi:hypothetical protein
MVTSADHNPALLLLRIVPVGERPIIPPDTTLPDGILFDELPDVDDLLRLASFNVGRGKTVERSTHSG